MAARIVLRVAGQSPAEAVPALRMLEGEGATEEELVAAAGMAALPAVYYLLHQLSRQRLLTYCVVGERLLASASDVSPLAGMRRRPLDDETRYSFSKAAFVRRDGEQIVIETARSSVQIAVGDSRVLSLLAELSTPRLLRELTSLPADEVRAVASLLLDCGVLSENDDEDDGPFAYWEFPDRLFHARSRIGRHRGGYGGTYAWRDRFAPLPANKPPMSDEAFDLFTPDLEALQRGDLPFGAVLERRCSRREFGDPPIHRQQLGEFLYRAARQRDVLVDPTRQELGSRPYPGGGAIYELEIYAAVDACVDLPRGFYHYEPRSHRLFKLPGTDAVVERFLRDARQSSGSPNPQIVLAIAARFPRFFWKYESIRYAAILKNVGVLYQTMYLVAEAMGLAACALGGGEADFLSEAAGLDYYAESAVGEFMIGSRR